MNDNFLMENPLSTIDSLVELMEEVKTDERLVGLGPSPEELIGLTNTILNSREFSDAIIESFSNSSNYFKQYLDLANNEIEKCNNNYYPENLNKILLNFMEDFKQKIIEANLLKGIFLKREVSIYKVDEDAILPKYSDIGDAGADIFALEDVTIPPKTTVLVRTGIAVAIPGGFEIQIRPRSGLSLKTGLRLPNSPATIDSGYRNEVKVIIENTAPSTYEIKRGDRIAQMVLKEVPKIKWKELTEEEFLKLSTDRGDGFGSSGK